MSFFCCRTSPTVFTCREGFYSSAAIRFSSRPPSLLCLFLFLVQSLAGLAWAQNDTASETQTQYRERLIETARLIREGRAVAAEPSGLPVEPGKCGTPIQAEITRLWSQYTPQQKALLFQISARPILQASTLSPSGIFRIHYDSTGVNEPALLDGTGQRIPGSYGAFVDSAAAAFDYSLRVEVDSLGFLSPPGDGTAGGGPEYDVYIRNLASGLFGQTVWLGERTTDSTRPNFTSQTYVEIDNDFQGYRTPGLEGLKVTAAHELNHAIQIGNYGLWLDEIYFYELTSTWLEDFVYDGINDYYFEIPRYFDNPGIPFNITDLTKGYAGYERGIWGIFLAKRHGPGIMRRTWERMATSQSVDALDGALNELGDSFAQSFVEFFLWNFYTSFRTDGTKYYNEAADFPAVKILSQQDISGGQGSIAGLARPLSGAYHQAATATDTVTIIAVNRDLQTAKGHQYPDASYSYELLTSDQGDSFLKLQNGVNVRFAAQNTALWQSVYLINNAISVGPSRVPDLFPNPFVLNGIDLLVIPTEPRDSEEVSISIFTSNFELVYSRTARTILYLGRSIITWNGETNTGREVSSGVYFFVLESKAGTSKGKFLVVKK